MQCTRGKEISVYQSAAGYYIGCYSTDEELGCEMPYCRISADYYRTRKEAEQALQNGFNVRLCGENDFCSGGKGCLVKKHD